MKTHHIIAALLILLFQQQIMLPMEERWQKINESMFTNEWDKEYPQVQNSQPSNTPTQLTINSTAPVEVNVDEDIDTLIATIDAAINKKYPKFTTPIPFFSFAAMPALISITQEDFLDIIKIITKHAPMPTITFINKLCEKNQHCKDAIFYFSDCACKNLEKVTIDTLETVQDPIEPQPISQLNKLPLIIKIALMKNAYNTINFSHILTLKGHTDTINCFDICSHTHQAATVSYDKTLVLWDLTTATGTQFRGKNIIADCIRFCPSGSHLLTIKNHDNNTCTISTWNTKLANPSSDDPLQKTALFPIRIDELQYGVDDTTFFAHGTVQHLSRIVKAIMTFSNDSNDNLQLNSWVPLTSNSKIKFNAWKERYEAVNLDTLQKNKGATLQLSKQNCQSLYLCNQAIKNSPKEKHKCIENVPTFQQLVPSEKNTIYALIQ